MTEREPSGTGRPVPADPVPDGPAVEPAVGPAVDPAVVDLTASSSAAWSPDDDEPARHEAPPGEAPVVEDEARVPDEPVPDEHVPDEPVPDEPVPDEPVPAHDPEPVLDEPPAATSDDERRASGTPDAPPPGGWTVLGRALRPRATRAQLLAGVLCALLGFAVVVQVRQTNTSALSGLRQSELVRILDETTERGDQLRAEVAELRGQRDELVSGSDTQQAALDSLRRNAITQGILSGRLPAEGPGVQVALVDPDGGLQPTTMLNMLEELRNAGAEAIQLNEQRITASSAFTGVRGSVELDGVPLQEPYTWLAIGDPDTLSIALQIPGGAMATVRGTGATGTVTAVEHMQILATRDLAEPRWATPVEPSGD